MKFYLALLFCLASRVAFCQDKVWSTASTIPEGTAIAPIEFAIDGNIYIGGGYGNTSLKFFRFDVIKNQWQQRAELPWPNGRSYCVAATIGSKAYVGLGYASTTSLGQTDSIFWEYDPSADTWSPLAPFPSAIRSGMAWFVCNSKLYIVGGQDKLGPYTTTYAYDPSTNRWAAKSSIPYSNCIFLMFFAIGNKGYVINQSGQTLRYDAGIDAWDTVATFPGEARWLGVGFALDGKGYAGLGQPIPNQIVFDSVRNLKDMYAYDVASNSWSRIADVPSLSASVDFGVAVASNKVYLGGGSFNDHNSDIPSDLLLSYPNAPATVKSIDPSTSIAYPNPALTDLNFAASGSITIYDPLGRDIARANGKTLNISTLPAGAYRYRLITIKGENDGMFVKR